MTDNKKEVDLEKTSAGLIEPYVIELSDYARDNLLWLLSLVGGLDALEPFDLADTGDWVHEIMYKLKAGSIPMGNPNMSRENLEESVRSWLKSQR